MNLRTAERFLLAPPLGATFGTSDVSVCDISAKGARFRHALPLEMGSKSLLRLSIEGRLNPVALEAVIVWTQADAAIPGHFVSGVRTYGDAALVDSVITQLQTSARTSRIEELRSTDRFVITGPLQADFGGRAVQVENLSARGARIALREQPRVGGVAPFHFVVPNSATEVTVSAKVAWTGVKAISGDGERSYRAGLLIGEKPELLRLAIGHLDELNLAALDTQSLRLKLKIIRARARQLAPSYESLEGSGIPPEQYLLIQGVREELRLNPEEAMHWYRRARLVINDPATRDVAPPIANHPDALAVWEYLDRSVDPTVVGRAFELPRK